MQPTGMAVLARLGLLERVLARGSRIDELSCRTLRGKSLFRLRYARWSPRFFGLGVHRGALFEALFDAVRALPVTLRPGVDVDDFHFDGKKIELRASGSAIAEHDFVVIAAGARSSLRQKSPYLSRARPYPWGALWFVGQDPDERFRGALEQVTAGTRNMLGFLPSGLGPTGRDVPLVSLFWSVRMDSIDAWREAGLEAWKQKILDFEPRAEELLEQIHDPGQVLTAGYVDGVMRKYHAPGVVFIGDAAHSTSPQLGQGTNLALLDAATLVDCLGEDGNVERALSLFSKRRAAQVRFYQRASRWLTPFFQSDLTWLGKLRDVFMPIVSRIGPFEAQMVKTLSGVHRGLLRPALPLPRPPER